MKIILIVFVISILFQRLNAQQIHILKSRYLAKPDTVLIYRPKNQNPNEKIPAVILLHGLWSNPHRWYKVMDLSTIANQYQLILIAPDGFDSWYLNSPEQPQSQWQTFFSQDLLPLIRKQTDVDTNRLFITGISMGGHGAIYTAIQHPHLFLAAGSSSGVLDLNQTSEKKHSLHKYLGDSATRYQTHSVINLLPLIITQPAPILIVDCGLQDPLIKCNLDFYQKAKSLNISIIYTAQNGEHTPRYWQKSLIQQLEQFRKICQTNSLKNKKMQKIKLKYLVNPKNF